MKKLLQHAGIAGGLVLLMSVVLPSPADAALLNLNGQVINAEQSGDMVIQNGVTMVSEDFLKDQMYLTLEKEHGSFKLENVYKDFVLEGSVGSNTLSLNGEEKNMSTDVQSIDGKLFVPLRPVIELFGDIGWVDADQTIYARYDYNDQLEIPMVQVSNEPIQYEIMSSSDISVDDDQTPIRTTEDGIIIEQRDENGNLVAIKIGGKTLIQPQHEGNILRWDSYEVEDDYLYWMEHPSSTNEITDDPKWYLYIQERKDGAEPVCVDSGSYKDVLTVSPTGGMLNNCDFKDGNIVWLRGDKSSGKFEARLYQHDTRKVTTLDSVPFDANVFTSLTMEVAVGTNDVFWTRAYFMESMREYGTMKRMHLDSGKVEEFSQGYNLLNPFVVGDYLIIRMKPEGNNFMPDTDKLGTYISGELWIYDLNENKWAFKVDNNLDLIGEKNVINTPVVLNDIHITVRTDSPDGYSMPIIDLENGTIHETVNENNESLIYLPYGIVGESQTIGDIKSAGSDGTCMATFRSRINGTVVSSYAPIQFDWNV